MLCTMLYIIPYIMLYIMPYICSLSLRCSFPFQTLPVAPFRPPRTGSRAVLGHENLFWRTESGRSTVGGVRLKGDSCARSAHKPRSRLLSCYKSPGLIQRRLLLRGPTDEWFTPVSLSRITKDGQLRYVSAISCFTGGLGVVPPAR